MAYTKWRDKYTLIESNYTMHARLQEWLQTLPSLAPQDFSEIHINVISPEYKASTTWIRGATDCLEVAIAFPQLSAPQGIFCAGFTMVGYETYTGASYQSCEGLSRQFGLTPPSVYYFGAEAIPWRNPGNTFQRVNISDFPVDLSR